MLSISVRFTYTGSPSDSDSERTEIKSFTFRTPEEKDAFCLGLSYVTKGLCTYQILEEDRAIQFFQVNPDEKCFLRHKTYYNRIFFPVTLSTFRMFVALPQIPPSQPAQHISVIFKKVFVSPLFASDKKDALVVMTNEGICQEVHPPHPEFYQDEPSRLVCLIKHMTIEKRENGIQLDSSLNVLRIPESFLPKEENLPEGWKRLFPGTDGDPVDSLLSKAWVETYNFLEGMNS